MSDLAGLLAAIRDAPEDDALRLILADWYDDHGDADRAEFIRLQVRRAAREGGWLRRYGGWREPRDRDWCDFVREACRDDEGNLPAVLPPELQETQLLDANRGRWGDVPGLSSDRGLPERWEGTSWDYLKHAEELGRVAPLLSVRLTESLPYDEAVYRTLGFSDGDVARDELARRLNEHPSLGNWVEVDFVGCCGDEFFRAVITSPHASRLRRLVAVGNETGPDVVEIVDVDLPDLRWIDLFNSNSTGGRPGDEEFIDLVTCTHLGRLEYFNYGSNDVGDEGVEVLAKSPTMSCLRSLSLVWNYVGRAGWEALAGARSLRSLRHLALSEPMADIPGDGGLAALLKGPLFPQLTYLAIDSTGVTDDGLARLAGTSAAARLRSLQVGGVRGLTAAGVRSLAHSPHLAGLRRLSLPSVRVGDEAAALLAAMPNLAELRAEAEGLSDEGKRLLAGRFGDGLELRDATT